MLGPGTPLLAQVAAIALGDATIQAVVAALRSTKRPVAIDKARIERHMRDLALEHASETVSDEADIARMAEMRSQRETVVECTDRSVPAERAVEWLRALGPALEASDPSQEKADLLHAIYERVIVAGPEIRAVRLTPAAYAHGLALALPEKVAMARPTGVGRALTAYELPIEGRDEWVAAARRLA